MSCLIFEMTGIHDYFTPIFNDSKPEAPANYATAMLF